ncbi:hypothetical protein GGI12_002560, partial [Dipsacomyces acuminosporus]
MSTQFNTSGAVLELEEQSVQCIQLHQLKTDTCLRISDKPFSTNRRETPAYSRLLAISNTYGYMVAGTPRGISVFKTTDAETALVTAEDTPTNAPVALPQLREIDLASHGTVTHVGVSSDELKVVVATMKGAILIFSALSLLQNGSNSPQQVIDLGEELRDVRPNPGSMPDLIAALTLAGEVVIANMADGSLKTIASKENACVTAICWSRKGKQIVCGDSQATLKQLLPTDGTVKRTIAPQSADENIESGASVLAVDWIDNYTFAAVYGQLPEGAAIPNNGGGGNGTSDDDDEIEETMTAMYVITQKTKDAPVEWLYVCDPCSAMDFPARYPGYHFAAVKDWGKSAPNIVIMSGTASTEIKTIGQGQACLVTSNDSPDEPAEWGVWEMEGYMPTMPLAVINQDESDTASLGMVTDFTGQRDLPPLDVSESTAPAKPVPIVWILSTDACLLGYYVYNTWEMKRNQSCAGMVDKIKPL